MLVCGLEMVILPVVAVDVSGDNLRGLSTVCIAREGRIVLHNLYTSLQLLYQAVEQGSQGFIVLHVLRDLLAGVDDRRVITSAEFLADVWQRGFGQVSAEVHGNLPRHRYILAAPLGLKVGNRDVKVG